jgi:polyhydroxybutyrate depolymerase
MTDHPTCKRYPECAEGVETILCTVEGGTHCGNYTKFKIPEVAWEVLQRYSLP